MMKKITNLLFSPITMGAILLIGAFAMAAATFIENDFGAAYAIKVVYGTWWFEALMVLFAINLLGSIFRRKLYKKRMFSVFLFHVALIVMIIGAGITRYFGYEGMMHIREGGTSDHIVTQNRSLNLELTDATGTYSESWDEDKINRRAGFSDHFKLNGNKMAIELLKYVPDAYEKAEARKGGNPIIAFVLANDDFRGLSYIEYGNTQTYGNTTVAFTNAQADADIAFSFEEGVFYVSTKAPLAEKVMGSDKAKTLPEGKIALTPKKLYQSDALSLVVQEALPEAVLTAVPSATSKRSGSKAAFVFKISVNDQAKEVIVWGGTTSGSQVTTTDFGESKLSAYYGYQKIYLPFKLQLDNFEITRYPGSHSPASFSSYVHILIPGEKPEPFHIYMNNILKSHGYRFYQSSYDNDEQGTILSVNYDSLGTGVTYFGYFLLFLGILWSMVNKNSFLHRTFIPKLLLLAFLLTGASSQAFSQNTSREKSSQVIDAKHADTFGTLLIQDNRGRTAPVYTFASDLIRKISRKQTVEGLTPVQLLLEMSMDYEHWMNVPMIKVSNKKLQDELGISGSYASYNDFLIPGMGYKLQKHVEAAFNKPPSMQDKFDKEVIKADERLNICYAIYSGSFLRLFPIPESHDEKWYTAAEAVQMIKNPDDSAFVANIIPIYFQALSEAKQSGNYKAADEYVGGMERYQQTYAGYELPSEFKVKAEVTYNKLNVFKKLFPYYTGWGLVFLFVLLGAIIMGKTVNPWIIRFFTGVIFLGFLAHTAGLAIRWYISGHAPMSNGYESLVFISWVTLLAGFIFSRQSWMALSATAILGGFTLMVANLSFMDPQITNLVPVLKSYWLTIHVSVITGSYGFLGLGALLGIINMILHIIQNNTNRSRIDETIESLTKINHRSLILGLYFLTIGTFLGAVWANESWGRYWGWDPKETWSLITMIIYTFVTHARMIPGVRGRFAFNTMSVYAFFSVLMTYFGVNYYLSGLHSYAGGDPVPVPSFVYISVGILVVLSIVSWFRFQMQDTKK
ncbi:MAG: c-type cytochrome biogenesis protein CcsB [Salinivirgaceae bacterium]